jgi:hypothetical protein
MGDVMTNKRKYTKCTVTNEPEMVAVAAATGESVPLTEVTWEKSDITRRRSERPKEDKPEVEAVDVPKLDNLGANEVTGLVEEAIYAHDMQDTVVRFDTVGRKWTFRPDQELGQTVFYIECAIPALTENLTISNSRFGLDGSRDEVKLAIEQLDEAVR